MPKTAAHTYPLGTPLPDCTHAVSVSLPAWADVVGYEEQEPRVLNALRACYPRFVYHPLVREVFARAEKEFCKPGEKCIVLPSKKASELGGAFITGRTGLKTHQHIFKDSTVLCYPEGGSGVAKEFWQHTGYILSSRQAEALLASKTPAPADKEEKLLKERIAGLSGAGAEDIWLFPGGMAAIYTAYRALQAIDPGKRTIQLGFPYVDTLKIQEKFSSVMPAQAGIHVAAERQKDSLLRNDMDSRLRGNDGVYFVSELESKHLDIIEKLLKQGDIGAVFCEFPTNPLLYAIDLQPLSELLRKYGVKLVVDDTIATWLNVDILPYADIIATSLTKSFSGGGDVLGGSLILNNKSPYYSEIKNSFLKSYENICYAEDIRVLEQNSRYADKHIRQTSVNAEALADFLYKHPKVERVLYPKFTNPEVYNKYKRQGGGYGCLLSVILKDPKDAPRFYDALDIAKGPSFGNDFTLACPYTLMAHYYELPMVNSYGVASELIRVSVGMEDSKDVIEKFRKALG